MPITKTQQKKALRTWGSLCREGGKIKFVDVRFNG